MGTVFLTTPAVLFIHDQILQKLGGSAGLRDKGSLLSALARPQATFGGQELYPTLFEKASVLLESLCQNHPFVDGNKRTAYTAAGLFLQQNRWTLQSEADDAVTFMLAVASGERRKEEIRIWIEGHAVPR